MIGRNALTVRGLVKRYGRRTVLDGLSLGVPAGCVMGVVGPNGAGKTTWMMAVAGLITIDGGEISLFGEGPFDARRHSGRLAMLPQDAELPLEATPMGFLTGLGRLQGLSAAAARVSAADALARLSLSDRAKATIRSLSHGMRKRLMSAQCLIGAPELVLLDEPMNGLDPEMADQFRKLVLAKPADRTVVISSHNLNDLERLCTHIAFFDRGKVELAATIQELTEKFGSLEAAYLARRSHQEGLP